MTPIGNISFDGTVSYLEYKVDFPYFSVFSPGAYLFEVWGAQGGCFDECLNVKGGYSRGVLYLKHSTKIFINVGQKGSCISTPSAKTSPAYNGGGIGGNTKSDNVKTCSGGGATDVRIKENTIYHRILVSGGGGGDTYNNNVKHGGYGGGLVGGNASVRYYSSGNGGNQESGGQGYEVANSSGTFGYGGNVTSWDGGGGGGGWYGGSAGIGCQDPGGGGSGFALSKSTYEIAKKQPKYAISKNYLMTNTKVFNGIEQHYGYKTINLTVGNIGNGKAKITILHSNNQFTCYVRCSHNLVIYIIIIVSSK